MKELIKEVTIMLGIDYPNLLYSLNLNNTIFIYEPRIYYHGLVLDFSAPLDRTDILIDKGYACVYVTTVDEVSTAISSYMDAVYRPIQYTEKAVKNLVQICSREFGVSPISLKMKGRKKETVLARHLAMYIMKNRFYIGGSTLTLKVIGDVFNRDHASVLHASNSIEDQMETNKVFRESVRGVLQQYGLINT